MDGDNDEQAFFQHKHFIWRFGMAKEWRNRTTFPIPTNARTWEKFRRNRSIMTQQPPAESSSSGRSPLWTHDEMTRLLHAWLEVVRSPATGASNAYESEAKRTCALFVANSDKRATRRSEDAVERRMLTLAGVARVAVAYNAQRTRPGCANPWLALSVAQQQRIYARQHSSKSFVAVDATLLALLTDITEAKRARVVPRRAIHSRRASKEPSSAWSKGELWALLAAWRHVLDKTHSKDELRHESLRRRVSKRFCALGRAGDRPQRTFASVRSKMTTLVQGFRLVESFNAQNDSRHDNGVADSRQRPPPARDWFAASAGDRAQFLLEWPHAVRNVSAFDRDLFNALRMLVDRAGSHALVVGASAAAAIDISSDDNDDNDGDDDWTIAPVGPSHQLSVAGDARVRPTGAAVDSAAPYAWPTVYQSSAWDTTTCDVVTPAPAPWDDGQELAVSPRPSSAPTAAKAEASDESDSEDAELTHPPRTLKRSKLEAECPSSSSPRKSLTASQLQSFFDALAKLKKKRKADKKQRRADRAERRELTALIAAEREQRRRDKRERQRDRREWELERDRMNFELQRMRRKLKDVRRQLRTS